MKSFIDNIENAMTYKDFDGLTNLAADSLLFFRPFLPLPVQHTLPFALVEHFALISVPVNGAELFPKAKSLFATMV